jgi:hypothetical protein
MPAGKCSHAIVTFEPLFLLRSYRAATIMRSQDDVPRRAAGQVF